MKQTTFKILLSVAGILFVVAAALTVDRGPFLSTVDFAIVVVYVLLALGIGIVLAGRANESVESFFLAGRSLPWWLIGISMAATTFAADTPLAITKIIRTEGIWGNWLWWCWGIGWVLATVIIAPLWRRSEVMTDAEFIHLRYEKGAGILRGFTAVYFGVVLNVIIIGWVVGAMSTILTVVTGWDLYQTAFGLMGIALLYSLLSGLWGVIVTDLVQFFFALGGTIAFAWLAVADTGLAWGDIIENVKATNENALSLFPAEDFFWGVGFFLVFQWWAYYQSTLNIYFAQRFGAVKTPADAEKAGLLFNILNFGIRHWPWIIVAVVSMYYYPTLQSIGLTLEELSVSLPEGKFHEAAYPLLMTKLPSPLLGIVLMGLLAAFMSTIDTHLNWGASYIVKDVWEPLYRKQNPHVDASEFETKGLWISKFAMLGIFALSIIVVLTGKDVASLWIILFSLTAGLGFVYTLRWLWYRINAACEIGAMLTSLGLFYVAHLLKEYPSEKNSLFAEFADYFGAAGFMGSFEFMFITTGSVLVVLVTAFVTKPDPESKRQAFVSKVKPPFWAGPETATPVAALWTKAITALAIVFGTLLFAYELLFGRYLGSSVLLYVYGYVLVVAAILYSAMARQAKVR